MQKHTETLFFSFTGQNPSPTHQKPTTMTRLSEDAIANILSRLHVKDLLRYRCVSKPWRFLVDSPRFIKMHLNHSKETHSNSTLILGDQRLLHSVDLDTLDSPVRLVSPIYDGGEIEILGCCNGLLALEFANGGTVIWNPSTRKYRKVPISGLIDLPFPDNLYEYGIVGFGYDPVNDDHKLARMVHYFKKDVRSVHLFHSEVKVYSLNFNTWKRVCDFPYQGCHRGKSILVGNSFHWLMGLQYGTKSSTITVAFDFVTEKYHQIPRANRNTKGKDYYSTMTELGGWLCDVVKFGKYSEKADYVDFWVMKEYGVKESWTKLLTVVPSNVTGSFKSLMPLAYFKSSHQILFDQDDEKFMLYDLEKKEAKSVKNYPRSFQKIACVRGLIGVGGGDEPNSGKKAEEDGNKKNKEKDKQQPSGKKRDDFLSKGFKLVL
ncbi:F-box protein CPR1-like [Humulus lupulus]|uniref:F-box protein CPR1-like n=1 Tax=Humulus lupulus TaxID=3486 RepID=UPI002B40546F|nr:F-box protein CPR1-like [Humulus lupulus]